MRPFLLKEQQSCPSVLIHELPALAESLAHLIIYSMFTDSPAVLPSGVSTPVPGQSGTAGSTLKNGLLGVAMTNAGGIGGPAAKPAKSVAGSKALDALVKLINTCESFFHPSVRQTSLLDWS